MKWLIECSPIEPQWLVWVTSTPRPERISSARQQQHGAEVARGQAMGLGVEQGLVGGHQAVGRLGVARVQQQVGEQPVDLGRGAADGVAQARPHHPQGRGRQHAEVEEHATGACAGRLSLRPPRVIETVVVT